MRCKIFTLIAALYAAAPLPAAGATDEAVVPCVILGGGVGGGTAGIYLGRARFEPIVIAGAKPGGALAQSEGVENWPGAMKIRGSELMEQIRQQAIASGAEYREEEAIEVDFSSRPFKIVTRQVANPKILKTYRAASCVIATGAKPNYLGVPGEEKYWGKGVSNCVTCDGALYKGKHVGIVGGGDSAVLEALYLSNIAKKVDVFVRKNHFRALDETRKMALFSAPNIEVHFETQVAEVLGNGKSVKGVVLQSKSGQKKFPLDGLFLAIGSTPNTALFKDQIEMDSDGYVLFQPGTQETIPYVCAIGDVVDRYSPQAVSAAGDAARAARTLQQKLSAEAPALIATYREAKRPSNKKKLIAKNKESAVIEIATVAQFEEELRSGVPLVVDFYATWCAPCKRIAPAIESSAEQLNGKYKFLKVNVDQMQELIGDYQIQSMPTVLLINSQGEVLATKVGEQQIGEFLGHLQTER